LEVPIFGKRLKGGPEWLGGNVGWLLDGGVNITPKGESNDGEI
jgi:hypothetical protein